MNCRFRRNGLSVPRGTSSLDRPCNILWGYKNDNCSTWNALVNRAKNEYHRASGHNVHRCHSVKGLLLSDVPRGTLSQEKPRRPRFRPCFPRCIHRSLGTILARTLVLRKN